ncbi:MAG: orotidine-5'-phosphate decarboxylase [bacterium]|nr:orotidine-5'-phosphate decarboxylase [bacterium]
MDKLRQAAEKIIVALDVSDEQSATRILEQLSGHVKTFKIGPTLFNAIGVPKAINLVRHFDAGIFFDGKFNEIPKIVADSIRSLPDSGIDFFTIHANAGEAALLEAAKEKRNMKMLAITVLTSLDDWDVRHTFHMSRPEAVMHFAGLAVGAGADGLVSSVGDLPWILQEKNKAKFAGTIKVVTGVRPSWYTLADDQRNVERPEVAIRKGANFIVVGRPITHPPREIGSMKNAFEKIVQEIAFALP